MDAEKVRDIRAVRDNFVKKNIFGDFASPLSARSALNRNLEVGQCRLFTMMPWTAVTQVTRIILFVAAEMV